MLIQTQFILPKANKPDRSLISRKINKGGSRRAKHLPALEPTPSPLKVGKQRLCRCLPLPQNEMKEMGPGALKRKAATLNLFIAREVGLPGTKTFSQDASKNVDRRDNRQGCLLSGKLEQQASHKAGLLDRLEWNGMEWGEH